MNDDKVTEPGDFEYRDLVGRIKAEWSVEDQEWKLPFYECSEKLGAYHERSLTKRMMNIDNWQGEQENVARELVDLRYQLKKEKRALKRFRTKITLIKDIVKAR